ncbi:MAG: P-loop NTPase [Thermodesulfobacteriota bacterium]|nr:P-loop NTPase [Thermodesulfobacteriota bacterium]
MTRLRPEIIQNFHRKEFSTPVIGVTGGKGGVGKTTIAVNIAASLADVELRVALVDADVDASNAAILLSLPQQQPLDVTITMPLFDDEKCNGCGECVKACRLNSLFLAKGKTVLLLGDCNGCEACFLVCPTEAISRGRKIVGQTYKTVDKNLTVYISWLRSPTTLVCHVLLLKESLLLLPIRTHPHHWLSRSWPIASWAFFKYVSWDVMNP